MAPRWVHIWLYALATMILFVIYVLIAMLIMYMYPYIYPISMSLGIILAVSGWHHYHNYTKQKAQLIKGPIKGYKAFNRDFTCFGGFQYQVGKTYELPYGKLPIPCLRGYHFCIVPPDCNMYYSTSSHPRYAEVLAWDVVHSDEKSVARKIQIIREITEEEWSNGFSSCFQSDNETVYLEKSQYHRLDGPAVIYTNGQEEWWINGQRHRLDGPAVICPDGQVEWYINGKRHRLDGPAVIYPDGVKEWWKHGNRIW